MSPVVFCICIGYEERKEKKEALQKEVNSSNPPTTPRASGGS
jgi:hypothetical protein